MIVNPCDCPPQASPKSLRAVEGDAVSLEAEHYTRKSESGGSRWIRSRVGRICPPWSDSCRRAPPAPGKDSPCLEYRMYLADTGSVSI
jgi:hypothetical protein